MATDSDVVVRSHGTIVTFEPVTEVGRRWFDENVQAENWQWLGPVLAVENRLAFRLVDGIEGDGLIVSGI